MICQAWKFKKAIRPFFADPNTNLVKTRKHFWAAGYRSFLETFKNGKFCLPHSLPH